MPRSVGARRKHRHPHHAHCAATSAGRTHRSRDRSGGRGRVRWTEDPGGHAVTNAPIESDALEPKSTVPEAPADDPKRPDKGKPPPPRFDLRASARKLRRAVRGGLLVVYTLLALLIGLAYPALTR